MIHGFIYPILPWDFGPFDNKFLKFQQKRDIVRQTANQAVCLCCVWKLKFKSVQPWLQVKKVFIELLRCFEKGMDKKIDESNIVKVD